VARAVVLPQAVTTRRTRPSRTTNRWSWDMIPTEKVVAGRVERHGRQRRFGAGARLAPGSGLRSARLRKLPHEGTRGSEQHIRLGLPQPPAYLFCDWLPEGFKTDSSTHLIILGGSDSSRSPDAVLRLYDSVDDPRWFGESLRRCTLTTHPDYLRRLAEALVGQDMTETDVRLVSDCATVMWLDTVTWDEARTWPDSAQDLVHPAALDARVTWIDARKATRDPCPCERCHDRRARGVSPL